jgi:DNA-binding LacI/PurR family transcriptional regulator
MAGSGSAAVRHLIDLGHRRIALVTHARFDNRVLHADAGSHADGYRAEMALAGLSPQIVPVDLDYDRLTPADWCAAGAASLGQLHASPAPPTAAVCYNDLLAYGLNRACRRQGIAVPAAMSIIGNGDMMLSSITGPPLTTMRFDGSQAGLDATRMLLRGIEEGSMNGLSPRLDLVLRESTAKPND